MKDIRIKERVIFSFGAQAYNALNHPNFDNPVADLSNPLFGKSVAEVAPPGRPARGVRDWYGRRTHPPGGSFVAWAAEPRRKRPRKAGIISQVET
jgi:hypothetical protein